LNWLYRASLDFLGLKKQVKKVLSNEGLIMNQLSCML